MSTIAKGNPLKGPGGRRDTISIHPVGISQWILDRDSIGDMKLFFLVLVASAVFAAEWEAVQRIPLDRKIEITTRKGSTRAAFVSATGEAMVVREKSGERSIARAEIRQVCVADPTRRVRNGLIGTAVGAGAGLAIGWAVCPYCANEGHGSGFIGPAAAAGGGLGALSFLFVPCRTVYKSK